MPHSMPEIMAKLVHAIRTLLANEKLAQFSPSEVAITFELGWLLRELFGDEWDVSGEYDRLGEDEKALQYPGRPAKKPSNRIRPDIIVHHMGETGVAHNLLVVEAKLQGNRRNHDYDDWKLRGMTWQQGEFGYFVGVHLVFFIPGQRLSACKIYVNGKERPDGSAWLMKQIHPDE
ncbi:hypothetical protein NKJ71_09610 [Mesorhizobium sp. M0050]|uniref:hypothetical protein n=1 Tax=Mesorhizobium sp. M0050 TaxID=2956861 RepID=UPI00333C3A54